eukprot:86672_1
MNSLLNLLLWCFGFTFIFIICRDTNYLFCDNTGTNCNDPWLQLISFWPYNPRILFGLLSFPFFALSYFIPCIFYDIIHRYNIFSSYRIKSPSNDYPNSSLIMDSILHDFILLFIAGPILWIFVSFNDVEKHWYLPIPNLWTICYQFLIAIYLFDILLYVTHRFIMHNKYVYGRFHKKHHEFKTSVAYAGNYATIMELILSLGPSIAIPMVFINYMFNGIHPIIFLLYSMYRMIESATTHSAYDLPFSFLGILEYLPGHWKQATFHGYHHSHNNGNFAFYWIDNLFGSDKNFWKFYLNKS